MQLRLYKSARQGRVCGECTACCTAIAVAALNKPINVRCQHVCEREGTHLTGGCSIYENRPGACASYQCIWLHGILPEKFRPDQCGVVWELENYRVNGALVLQAYLMRNDVTIEQIDFQLSRLRQEISEPIVCHVVPAGMSCSVYGAFHLKRVRADIFVADREATKEDMQRCAVVGKRP